MAVLPLLALAAAAAVEAAEITAGAAVIAGAIIAGAKAIDRAFSDDPPGTTQSCPLTPVDVSPPVAMSTTHDNEDYAEDIDKSGTTDCDALEEAIKSLIAALQFRYDDMAEHGGGDPGHRERYDRMRDILRSLISKAHMAECNVNTSDAEEWADMPPP